MARTYQSAVAHLTKEQLERLIFDYYAAEKPVEALLKEYGVLCPPNLLRKTFPPEVNADLPCPYCGVPMCRERPSRTSFSFRSYQAEYYCPECGHRKGHRCDCRNCSDIRDRERENALRQRREIVAAYCSAAQSNRRGRVSAEALSLREAVALLTAVRTCTFIDRYDDQGNTILGPLSTSAIPMAPGQTLGINLLQDLRASGMVCVSDLSPLEAFEINHGKVAGFNPSRVFWAMTIDEPILLLEGVERLATQPQLWPESWFADALPLWEEIAFEECWEYFAYEASARGLPPAGSTSTKTMLSNLLRDYSVAQCYRVVYAGAQQAADFLIRTGCTKKHAANYMIGACQRWADRARSEKWVVPQYRRRFDLPRSALSYVFCDVFLDIGERGFTEPLSLQPVNQLLNRREGY